MKDAETRVAQARKILDAMNQGHILQFWGELNPSQRENLLNQIEQIDWPEVARLIQSHVLRKSEFKLPDEIKPAPYFPHMPRGEMFYQYDDAYGVGQSLIREGKVAAFTVAGGQGTRLGLDAPKGTYPATPIRQAPLFQVFAEFIAKVQQKYEAVVPWYIMTSPVNDAPTRAFFEEHDYFGLKASDVMFFPQAMMPAMDSETGQVLMMSKDSMALSPNGHGGSLKALYTSGAIADMRERGIEQISYFQVDNPNVKCIDPQFIGLHATQNAQMSSKMLAKAFAKEKVGNFCLVDNRVTVIEYSDMPDELVEQRDENGELRFIAGSIAIHVMTVDFVESLNASEDGFGLPFHRAEKKVAHLNLKTGDLVEPTSPNAVKLETFIFDALPLCDTSIIYETDRTEEFAPIKNTNEFDDRGMLVSNDCPQTSIQLQVERAANWLEEFGVKIPRNAHDDVDALIEITPLAAIEPGDLQDRELPKEIKPGSKFLME